MPRRDELTLPDKLTEENTQEFCPVNLLKGKLRAAYETIPSHLKTASEIELSDFANPTPIDYALRQRFTELIHQAKDQGQEDELPVMRFYKGLITQHGFLDLIAKPHKMAFISREVVTHAVYYAAIHAQCLKHLWKILTTTEVDPKHMTQILKLTETAANRTIGPVIQLQKIQMKQEVTHTGDPREVSTPDDPETLRLKIKEMQAKLAQVRPIEIEAKVVDEQT